MSVVPGLEGDAIRFNRGRVSAWAVRNFSADREMTVVAWVRCLPEVGARRIIGRENGGTLVALQVTAGGQPRFELRSTVGNYIMNATGTTRIDDGEWHLVAGVTRKRYNGFGSDTRGLSYFLWIDGELDAQGYMTPGIFGATPNFGMTTDVVLGQGARGDLAFTGDIQTAAVAEGAANNALLRQMWSERPAASGGTTGWGIVLS
ncbi:MAG: hypothetical protein HLX50_00550 [Alteromonadaceae bacterium]|nr:hypothetical protein [Alteromonadaceae bacterium]